MRASSPPPPTWVTIDAACDMLYASYYIQGLWEVFGRQHTRFASRPFRAFRHSNTFFCCTLQRQGSTCRVVIDYGDSPVVQPDAYAWADVYGKVNVAFGDLAQYPKLVAMGPSFAIRLWGAVPTWWHAGLNLLRSYRRIPHKRRFLADYKGQWQRLPLQAYLQRQTGQEGYVYFVSTLWKKEATTNAHRAAFMRACKALGIRFEGGFAPRRNGPVPGFDDLTMPVRTTIAAYVHHNLRSMAVFNTPAVLSCHGWKLAEFLAMGKCILSDPLSRDLPAPLQHGRHLLLTDGSQPDLEQQLRLLMQVPSRRLLLEQEAAAYFDQYLAPAQVIRRLAGKEWLGDGHD